MNEVRKVIGVVGGKLWSSPVYSLAVDWDAQARPAGSELKNTVRRWVVFVLVGILPDKSFLEGCIPPWNRVDPVPVKSGFKLTKVCQKKCQEKNQGHRY